MYVICFCLGIVVSIYVRIKMMSVTSLPTVVCRKLLSNLYYLYMFAYSNVQHVLNI